MYASLYASRLPSVGVGECNMHTAVSTKYVCQNPARRKEIEAVQDSSLRENGNPRCSCGAQTKKVYAKPMVRKWMPLPSPGEN